ncbi:putative Bro-N domain-containing protein [Hirudovirus strain Sangsue]|nr:putative Bro-N domain-containing protein [Hirudovirus strain Sangsue]
MVHGKIDLKFIDLIFKKEVNRFFMICSISYHVESYNRLIFEEICNNFPIESNSIPKTLDKKTKFINLSGFCNLIHHSKKPFAMKIKKWLDDEVIPALIMDGVYSMQPKELKVKFFYEDNYISDFFGKNCLYIAYVGVYNGVYIFKFGLTRRMFERDYLEHLQFLLLPIRYLNFICV